VQVRIALDAMGTDRYPGVEVEGAIAALKEFPGDFGIVLVGDRDRIEAELSRVGGTESDRLSIIHTSQRIKPGEAPATAVRRKPDSSIVRGLMLEREGQADAFVSAGSTGAVMAASLFILRPLSGVDRPAIATVLPTASGPLVMLDAGANVDSKPTQLVQWARLGTVYAQDVRGQASPRVGLLNIGEEPEKGDELAVETHRRLLESELNFIGNVEGRDIIGGPCDVLVTDGFVGNVLLKFYESVATFVSSLLMAEIEAAGVELNLEEVLRVLDYTEYGGAPLLGVNGLSIICHGGSPPRAIKNAIRVALQAAENHMVGHIRAAVAPKGGAERGLKRGMAGKPEGAEVQ